MIANTSDGSAAPPRLRMDINASNVFGLPEYSSAPTGDSAAVLLAVKSAGFEGIQTNSKASQAKKAGLRVTASGRVNAPADADAIAAEAAKLRADCCTLHVGWGMESDDEIDRLIEAILRASEKHRVPLYVETHRATITQDIWRTVQLTKRFPEIRFNGDFSHYYTGLELPYGDIEAKWQFMQPIFDRVRFIHARIGNSGCIQVGINPRGDELFVEHFRQMWMRSMKAFRANAKPGDFLCFTPELLGPEINYARAFPAADGTMREESDRWAQALQYVQIARDCWTASSR